MLNNVDINKQTKEKKRVALSSVVAAFFLVFLKFIVGFATGSLGIISEALHSTMDLVAAGITFFAVKVSGKPADADHHYGHAKIEGISALAEVVLLLGACIWIIYEAVHRLIHHRTIVEVTIASFAVMGVSILVDMSRSKALYRVAKKYKSQALEADALHFKSDIWSSVVVVVGLILVKVGLPLADSLAAIGVAVLIMIVSIKLGKKSIDMLLDRAPRQLRERIEKTVKAIPGVSKCTQLRVRRVGIEIFVDMNISVNKDIPFEEVHRITGKIEKKVGELIPDADMTIHTEPVEIRIDLSKVGKISEKNTVEQVVKEHFTDFVDYHKLSYDKKAKPFPKVNFHLVIPKGVSLEEGHKLCDHLEEDIKNRLGETDIFIHLEPCDGECARCKKDCEIKPTKANRSLL